MKVAKTNFILILSRYFFIILFKNRLEVLLEILKKKEKRICLHKNKWLGWDVMCVM